MADLGPCGLGFLAAPTLDQMARIGVQAEQTGYASVWVAETQNRRDAVTAAATMLHATRHVRVGAAGINVYTRAAGLVGITFGSLAETYGSRVVVGLGVGSASTLRQLGIEVAHPIGRLREYVDIVRAVSTPAIHDYPGRYARLDGLARDVCVLEPPAVYLCVGGPQALRLAASRADGVLLDLFLPVRSITSMVGTLHDASRRRFAGAIAAGVMVAVADDVPSAMSRVRPFLARYLIAFPELVREMGVDRRLVADVAAAQQERGDFAAGALVGDELVDELSVCGPPARCRGRLDRYAEAGVTDVVLFPEPGSLDRVAAEPILANAAR